MLKKNYQIYFMIFAQYLNDFFITNALFKDLVDI